jgi:tetratricopeptide (TPR) repeat protein
MKHRLQVVLVALGLLIAAAPALAQQTQIKGTLKGQDGKPMVGVIVDMVNLNTGQKFHLKTDKKGEFFSIGVSPGKYNVSFLQNGKEIWHINGVDVTLQKEVNTIDVDLAKEMEAAKAQQQSQMTEEQKKELEKAQAENVTIKNLNAMLQQAHAAIEAGTPEAAIPILQKATQVDPTRALLWAQLGSANVLSAKKDTDSASRNQKYAAAVEAYKKAIDLTNAATDPKAKAGLGGYYNNYGEVLGRTGKTEETVAAYTAAVTADPANAAMYYRNLGITMENTGKTDEAVAAYDKAIAADPTAPDSYFRKGIALVSKATTKGDKIVPAPGTEDAFNKYLELAPDGPNAETAKQMLATIGAPIKTSYGTQKSAGKKK